MVEAADVKRAILAELNRHPFVPAWWLPGPHAQTVWPALFRRRAALPPVQKIRLDTPDGDFLDIWVQAARPGAPTILLLHGLEGSFRSRYIWGMHHTLGGIGWNAVTMEHRSCGGEINRARRMYHMGETSDLALVVQHLIERHATGRLYLCGYSLGGNVIAKWLGESGTQLPDAIAGAAAISSPYNLLISGPYMDRPVIRPYRMKFLRTLKKKAILKDRQYPGIVDLPRVLRSTTFEQFDSLATAPLHGFKDAADYWKQVSCGQFLDNVRRPLLLVSAEDDPFIPGGSFPTRSVEESPYLYPLLTRQGGHVGFVYGDPWRPGFWAEEQVVRFFTLLER